MPEATASENSEGGGGKRCRLNEICESDRCADRTALVCVRVKLLTVWIKDGKGYWMVHVFVDFEMNVINKIYREERAVCKREIIEIGAVKLDDTGEEIGSFTQYVKPEYGMITDYYANLTGITNEKVERAPHFLESMHRFYDWIGDEAYRIYSWSDSDPLQISREAQLKQETDGRLQQLLDSWIDYQKEFGRMLGIEKKVGLKDAVHAIGADFEGRQHDALWDARNTADIYRLSLDKKKFNKVMKPIVELFKPQKTMGTSLGELFGSEFSMLFDTEAE